MKIKGHKVIFGPISCTIVWNATDEGKHIHKQYWRIPTLELYGYINPQLDVIDIIETITKEVNKDLMERKRFALGLQRRNACHI